MNDARVHDLRRLRVDNLGSMLRPPALLELVQAHNDGGATDDQLRDAQDRAIANPVAEQERHALPIIVDGEFRRAQFMESFAPVAGFEEWGRQHARARATSGRLRELGGARVQAPSAVALTAATEPLRLIENKLRNEFEFTQSCTRRPVKVTLIGPERIYQAFDGNASRAVYADDEAFIRDTVTVIREIIGGLAEAGCRYTQIDAPGFTSYVDAASIGRLRARRRDPAATLAVSIAAENAAVRGFDGMTFGIHLCRGNERSHWHREGPYDAIAEQLFTELSHHRLLLEYDTERAGTFDPLRFVPPDKTVVLGLITTKNGRLESLDSLLRRVEAACSVHRCRTASDQSAMRICLGRPGEPAQRGRAMGQA